MADQTKKPDIKHFRMQIVDETGQILKGERFYEINKKDIRTVTLLPNEKLFVEMDFNEKKIRWIDYILESRGLGKKKSAEHATIVNGVLILACVRQS